MKWMIDFDDLNDVKYDLEDCEEFIENFINTYKQLMENIMLLNEGKFFNSISDKIETEIPYLEKVLDSCRELKNYTEEYIDRIEDSDSWVGSGIYKVDKGTVENEVRKVSDLLERNITQNPYKFTSFEGEMGLRIQRFNNLDAQIDIETEYAINEEVRRYLYNRREEIRDDIQNYNRNIEIIHSAIASVKELENELEYLSK